MMQEENQKKEEEQIMPEEIQFLNIMAMSNFGSLGLVFVGSGQVLGITVKISYCIYKIIDSYSFYCPLYTENFQNN